MDFKKGQYVFHRRCGVCLVEDIAPLSPAEKDTLYYNLRPCYGEEKTNLVRVPFSNTASLFLPLSKKDAKALVQNWPSPAENHYVMDAKIRRLTYDTALKNGMIGELAPLLEGIHQKKAKEGHLNSMDAQFVSRIEPLVYGELAYSLDIPYEDVPIYILNNRN